MVEEIKENKIEVELENKDEVKNSLGVEDKDDIRGSQENKNKVEAIKVDPILQETLVRAFRSKRYLICVSRLEGDKLSHQTFTNDFKKGDIAPTLDEWSNLLTKEMQE